jgi:sirohydrochlorin cobaltochelatase
MPDAIEAALQAALVQGHCCFGEVAIRSITSGYQLTHRDDAGRDGLRACNSADEALQIAKFSDAGEYRALKTAPNLAHGWALTVSTLDQLRRALDYLYPGRLEVFLAWQGGTLRTTPIRETLERQTGMYRTAARISEPELDNLVANFCRSDGGCLRTILWHRDAAGTAPSSQLPPQKFDGEHDQTGRGERAVPLICQEACNLLVAECRKVVASAKS